MLQMLFFSLQFLYLISDGLVGDEEIDEDGNEGERDEEPPAELPVDARRDVHHELDVPVRSSRRYPIILAQRRAYSDIKGKREHGFILFRRRTHCPIR
jgi:hypothetical protein